MQSLSTHPLATMFGSSSARRLAAVLATTLLLGLPTVVAAQQPQGLGGGESVAPAAPPAPPASLPAAPPQRPRIGLVLSGGGARGAAHIGVIKVLEELRVPVDVIAGTSMGSIVGSSYASGQTVANMTRDVAHIKTEMLAKDQPPRPDLGPPEADDWRDYIGPQFGYRDGSLQLPKGAITGVALEAVLRELALAKGDWNFDKLPIPFRAIATDVYTGQMTVLKSGDLATAMRASMSVPGAVAPVPIGGKLLVDGGLTRNLPVDVARAMGAEVIIAVNLGTPLLPREQITSAFSVALQMLNILTEQNVGASLASLKPQDVLILPELGDYSAGDFDHMPSTIPIGEAAARKLAGQLERYSLPPEQYAAHRQQQVRVVAQDTRPVDELRVEGLERVNEQVVIQSMETTVGSPLDVATLDLDMRRIYGRGDFEHVQYQLIDEPEHRILAVQAVEKSWGPTYVRFGLSLSSDFRGDNAFNLLASIRRTWLNKLGGEWRADVQVGNDGLLFTEFYQPLTPSQYFSSRRALVPAARPISTAAERRRPGGALQRQHRHRGGGPGQSVHRYGEHGRCAGRKIQRRSADRPAAAAAARPGSRPRRGACQAVPRPARQRRLPAQRLQARRPAAGIEHAAGRQRQLQPRQPELHRRQVLR
jgi:NTE family protein